MNTHNRAAWFLFTWIAAWCGSEQPVSGAPAPALIAISATGSQVTVTWSDTNSYLESAYEVPGPWFPVPGAASGYTLRPSQSQQYFRLSSEVFNPTLLPTAAAYSFSVLHDQMLTVDPPGVLQFDFDPSGLPLTAYVASDPVSGIASIAADGTLFYTPAPHFTGVDSFYYIVTDGLNVSTPTLITVTVTNTPPVAVNAEYGVAENSYVSVSAPGVLANDYDPDGDTISLVTPPVSGPAHGSLTLYPDGSFTYLPNANFSGMDSFTYTITDGVTSGNVATVTLNVHPDTAQPPPVAGNSTYSTSHDEDLYVSAPGVLLNCSDPDSDPLSAALISGTTNGVLSLYADGSFSYLPNAGFVGQDSFTYDVADSTTNSASTTVTIYVTNSVPVANNDAFIIEPNQTLTEPASGVLAIDTDADNDPLTAQLVNGPGNGTLTFPGDGSFVYTPETNFLGVDSFTYTAFDGFAYSSPATVTINVTNQVPVGVDETFGAQVNETLTVPAPGVLLNDYEPNGDNLTAQLLNPPVYGSLAFDTNGSFTYLPSTNFVGTDTFTYLAEDGTLASEPVTVTVFVHATNTPPVGVPDAYQILPDEVLSVDATDGVLVNDYDAENDELTATLVSGPTNAFDFALNSDGTFTYVPNVGFAGADTFTYQAFDGLAYSAPTLVTITVTNSGPIPQDLDYTTHFNTPLSVAQPGILGFVEDQDDNPLTALLVAPTQHGSLALTPVGSFQYTPATNFTGKDFFTWQVSDGVTTSAVMRVSIAVTDTAPVASPESYDTLENTPLTNAPSVLASAFDADSDPLAASLVSGPTHAAAFSFSPDGTFAYTPQSGFVGVDSFTFQVSDGVSNSPVTVAQINVGNTPVAFDDYYNYLPGETLMVPASNGVLANDFPAGNPGLTAVLAGGSPLVSLNSDGSFTFLTPLSYSSSPITFQYVARLNGVSSAPATVTLEPGFLLAAGPAAPAAPPPPPPPPPLILTDVTFSKGNSLLPDTGGAAFAAPQWLNQKGDGTIDAAAGDHAFPYSYVAGKTLCVEPTFTVNDEALYTVKNLDIQGVVYNKNTSLNIIVPVTLIRFPEFSYLGASASLASTAFSTAANFYNPLTIKWQFSTDGLALNAAKKKWQSYGTSMNKVYLIQAPTVTSLNYQSVVEYGSREGAGLTSSARMVASLSRYFSTRRVMRASDDRTMTYYRNWTVGNTTVPSLLNNLDGQCGSWCELFKAALEAQGISGAAIINVESVKSTEQFLVNNWTFGARLATNPLNGTRNPKYPYINIPRNMPAGRANYIPAAGQDYLWWSTVVRAPRVADVTFGPEVVDAVDGVPGQNNARPAKLFVRHFVVSINNQYFDPSYGLTYTNSQDLYLKAIAGFAIGQNTPYNGLINNGAAVDTYDNALATFRIRRAPAAGLDQLKVAEIDQKVVFTVQPDNTEQKTPITPAVKVQIQDWYGNAILVPGIPITISLFNVGAASPTALVGATAMTDATGTATFSALQVNTPVAKCRLLAESPSGVSAVSDQFRITP